MKPHRHSSLLSLGPACRSSAHLSPLLGAGAGELAFVPRFRIQSEDRIRKKNKTKQDKVTQRRREGGERVD